MLSVSDSANKSTKYKANEYKLQGSTFPRLDLRGVARVYSHDSLSRFWSNYSTVEVTIIKPSIAHIHRHINSGEQFTRDMKINRRAVNNGN